MSLGIARPILKALLTLVFLALIGAGIARALFILPATAEGNEMAPTIFMGDFVAARLRTLPTRGDVVLYSDPKAPKRLRIGRVIGLPGETVSFVNQVLLLNGKPLPRSQGKRLTFDASTGLGNTVFFMHTEQSPEGRTWNILLDIRRKTKDMTLEAHDGYILLGDNRNHAVDSRELGAIPKERIRGVVRYFIKAQEVGGIPPREWRLE